MPLTEDIASMLNWQEYLGHTQNTLEGLRIPLSWKCLAILQEELEKVVNLFLGINIQKKIDSKVKIFAFVISTEMVLSHVFYSILSSSQQCLCRLDTMTL